MRYSLINEVYEINNEIIREVDKCDQRHSQYFLTTNETLINKYKLLLPLVVELLNKNKDLQAELIDKDDDFFEIRVFKNETTQKHFIDDRLLVGR